MPCESKHTHAPRLSCLGLGLDKGELLAPVRRARPLPAGLFPLGPWWWFPGEDLLGRTPLVPGNLGHGERHWQESIKRTAIQLEKNHSPPPQSQRHTKPHSAVCTIKPAAGVQRRRSCSMPGPQEVGPGLAVAAPACDAHA